MNENRANQPTLIVSLEASIPFSSIPVFLPRRSVMEAAGRQTLREPTCVEGMATRFALPSDVGMELVDRLDDETTVWATDVGSLDRCDRRGKVVQIKAGLVHPNGGGRVSRSLRLVGGGLRDSKGNPYALFSVYFGSASLPRLARVDTLTLRAIQVAQKGIPLTHSEFSPDCRFLAATIGPSRNRLARRHFDPERLEFVGSWEFAKMPHQKAGEENGIWLHWISNDGTCGAFDRGRGFLVWMTNGVVRWMGKEVQMPARFRIGSLPGVLSSGRGLTVDASGKILCWIERNQGSLKYTEYRLAKSSDGLRNLCLARLAREDAPFSKTLQGWLTDEDLRLARGFKVWFEISREVRQEDEQRSCLHAGSVLSGAKSRNRSPASRLGLPGDRH